MDKKNLHCGHRDRIRKRLLETGGRGFCSHELLELLLFYVLPRVNTNELAHGLTERFGSLSSVLTADPDELTKVKGISSSTAGFLQVVYRLCTAYTSETGSVMRFSGTGEICSYLVSYFAAAAPDVCLILNLGPQLQLLNSVSFPAADLADGTVTARELAEISLKNRSRRIVAGINHAGRLPVPTEEDFVLARRLAELLAPLSIPLADVIICGCGHSFSMREKGAFSFGEV